jgi:glycosidase
MNPILYEINTRCWLRELSERFGRPITLANVPDEEFARWQKLDFTHIWLMGVWTTGTRSRELACQDSQLRRAYNELLPGWRQEDVAGSPYAIAEYTVPPALGGNPGLREFRTKLHRAGLKLILDFVPNHVGLDHPWLRQRPDLFVQSPAQVEGTFAQETGAGRRWIAHGKDPHFPCWSDVAQLDYRRPETRAAMRELLLAVAAQCDGVRCDMAMLLLNEVFGQTWAAFPPLGAPGGTGGSNTKKGGPSPGPSPSPASPGAEFWADAIPAVRQVRPDFLFLAEVYWDLEARMQALGFDYTYDKHLYDDLIWKNAAWAQRRLLEPPPDFTAACAHFLENHDEPRVAAKLTLPEHRAAALVILGLPGMRFLHEGQLTGARIKVPVQLGRRPAEAPQPDVQNVYDTILTTLSATAVGRGRAQVLSPREAWPGNPSAQNFIVVQWQSPPEGPTLAPPRPSTPATARPGQNDPLRSRDSAAKAASGGRGREFDLVAVNLAPHRSQCYVPLKIPDLAAFNWSMRDLLGTEAYERFGSDLEAQGLYLDLPEHGAQIFHLAPIR